MNKKSEFRYCCVLKFYYHHKMHFKNGHFRFLRSSKNLWDLTDGSHQERNPKCDIPLYFRGQATINHYLVAWKPDGHYFRLKYTLKEPTIETGDTASLTITNLHRNDEGSYRCNATNQLTTVISDAATLTVHCKFISLFYKSRRTHASLKVQGMTWTVWQTDLSYECCYFILFKCALALDIVCYVILYLIRCNNRETKEL